MRYPHAHSWKSAAARGVLLLGLCAGPASIPPSYAADADIDSRLDTLFGAHAPTRQFLAELQSDAAGKNWPAIAARVAYPLRIALSGKRTRIRTPVEFAAHAGQILTPKVLGAIRTQAYGALFANAQGVMIGDGEVWFSSVCKDTTCSSSSIKITAFNP